METRYFRYGVGSNREVNFIGKRLQLRIALHQFALWRMKDMEPIFNFIW